MSNRGHGGPRATHGAEEIQVQKRLEFLRVGVQDRAASRAARTVDQRVQLAELLVQRLKQPIDRVLTRDIGHDSLRPESPAVPSGTWRCSRATAWISARSSFAPACGKMRGQPPAESGGAARDQNDFVLPIVHCTSHPSLPLPYCPTGYRVQPLGRNSAQGRPHTARHPGLTATGFLGSPAETFSGRNIPREEFDDFHLEGQDKHDGWRRSWTGFRTAQKDEDRFAVFALFDRFQLAVEDTERPAGLDLLSRNGSIVILRK